MNHFNGKFPKLVCNDATFQSYVRLGVSLAVHHGRRSEPRGVYNTAVSAAIPEISRLKAAVKASLREMCQ
jgi:hypothetical protein